MSADVDLRRLIRHAKFYGVTGVYEAGVEELPAWCLGSLRAALATIDPDWCSGCGDVLPASPVGRPRRYGSDACRQRAYRKRAA